MIDDDFEDPTAEIEAMKTFADTLAPLSKDARQRVLSWTASRFLVENLSGADNGLFGNNSSNTDDKNRTGGSLSLNSFAELIESVDLKSNSDRALFAGYWLQEIEGEDSFDGRSVNKLLKEHGIDVSNVTNALASLINTKPRRAMQAGKKGKFEKLYRLTTEGKKEVTRRLVEEKTDD